MKFEIRNYRHIPYNNPIAIELRDGITFVLGPNNLGKTNFIGFFYDLRAILKEHNLDMLKGQYKAKMETYFDEIVNRFSNEGKIQFSIENDTGNRATFEIAPQNKDLEHTQEVSVVFNFQAGALEETELFIKAVRRLFSESLFVGQSRSITSRSVGRSMDIDTGSTFINNFSKWADGPEVKTSKRIKSLKEELRVILGVDVFNLRLNDERSDLIVTMDDEEFRLSELGTGISEFIIVLTYALVKNPEYIFIDEPETSLHPKLQEVFIRALASKSKRGLFAASHSIGLARSAGDAIYSLSRTSKKVPILNVFGSHYTPTIAQSINEMGYSQFAEIGGNNILLVEGRTDIKSFREILRKYSVDSKYIILSFGGSQFMTKDPTRIVEELNEIKRLNPSSISVIFDSECGKANEQLKPEFKCFVDTCEMLGFNVFATDRHSTENYITQAAIEGVVGKKFHALGPFEKFGSNGEKWSKEKNWLMFNQMQRADFEGTGLDMFITSRLL